MKPMTLQKRIFSYGALFVSLVAIMIGVSFYFTMSNGIEKQIGIRALSIAKTTADRPDVRAGFESVNPTEVLQPIAEAVRLQTGAEYVVIGNSEGTRYAHPVVERIGQQMVGDDNERALQFGESYVSQATGSLGPALRGKTPVFNEQGDIIGVISVGYLNEDISTIFFQYIDNISFIVFIAIVIGVIGSSFLARNIKKELFDLEPAEIANLFTERNALIESVREGIIMVDAKGVITTVNAAAYDALSIPGKTELIGRTIQEVLPNTQLPKVLETGERHLDRPMEIHGRKVIVNRIPIRANEQIIGAVSTFRLQSEIDQLSMELSQVKRYTEALRAQTHEYNNFLYTISGLIQLHSYDEALSLIHDETAEHQSLIQFVTKRLQDPFLGGIVIGFFNRAKELKVQFLLDEDSFLDELPAHLEKTHFVSIIGNLVTNAFEAVEMNPEAKRMVRLFILDNGEEILFEVEDSGRGIANEVLDALFQEKVSTKDREDRGYGLMKVAEYVEDLGGSITIEKGDLGGALFIISIPKGGDCMRPIEVLIIEDDKRIADIHHRFIDKIEGFTVVGSAHTGEEAKDWVQALSPDLVLLDVYLPDALGTEIMGFIHNNSPDTDIIFITAAAEVEIVKKAYRRGVADYILKPLTFDRFKESLLTYKAKREKLASVGVMKEDSIQFLWNKTNGATEIQDSFPPKGIDPITKEKVVSHMKQVKGGMTAETLGLEIGVSRSTARRYLEHLVSEKQAYTELIYGSVGRPERRYFIKQL